MSSEIFNEGLLLCSIMDYLPLEDIVKLHWVSDLRDTIDTYIERRKRANEESLLSTLNVFMDEYRHVGSIGQQIEKLNVIFEYLVSNRWFVQNDNFGAFEEAVERKLFEFAQPYSRYHHQALYFLEELYNIQVQANMYAEYVEDRYGNKLFICSVDW